MLPGIGLRLTSTTRVNKRAPQLRTMTSANCREPTHA
jgi:hypothetical protein